MSDTFCVGKIRKKEYEKLKVFLRNPGRFCLFVLGASGTGKHYAIELAFNELKKNDKLQIDCFKELTFIDALEFPNGKEELNLLFKENEHHVLVIEDVEHLNNEQQELLFSALSTTDGKLGVTDKVEIRVVFTSSIHIDRSEERRVGNEGRLMCRSLLPC